MGTLSLSLTTQLIGRYQDLYRTHLGISVARDWLSRSLFGGLIVRLIPVDYSFSTGLIAPTKDLP